jgi:hypothetical protein
VYTVIKYYKTENCLRMLTGEGIARVSKSHDKHIYTAVPQMCKLVYSACKEFLGLLHKPQYHSLLQIIFQHESEGFL